MSLQLSTPSCLHLPSDPVLTIVPSAVVGPVYEVVVGNAIRALRPEGVEVAAMEAVTLLGTGGLRFVLPSNQKTKQATKDKRPSDQQLVQRDSRHDSSGEDDSLDHGERTLSRN